MTDPTMTPVLTTLRNGASYNGALISTIDNSIWKSDVNDHSDPDTEMTRWDEPDYSPDWADNDAVYPDTCGDKCMNYKLLYYAHATHLGLFVGRCSNEEKADGSIYVSSEQVRADWGFICRSNTDTKEQQIQYIEEVFGSGLNQLVTDYLPISKVCYLNNLSKTTNITVTHDLYYISFELSYQDLIFILRLLMGSTVLHRKNIAPKMSNVKMVRRLSLLFHMCLLDHLHVIQMAMSLFNM